MVTWFCWKSEVWSYLLSIVIFDAPVLGKSSLSLMKLDVAAELIIICLLIRFALLASTLHIHLICFDLLCCFSVNYIDFFLGLFVTFFFHFKWGSKICNCQKCIICAYFIQQHFAWLPHLCFFLRPRAPSGALG
jgi:hypothetical protein